MATSEYFELKLTAQEQAMRQRLPAAKTMSATQFQTALINADGLESKLAICFSKLSESGVFSDAPPEVWNLRRKIEEVANGHSEKAGAG